MSVSNVLERRKVAKVAEGSNKGSSYNPYGYYIIYIYIIIATFATLFCYARESIYILCDKHKICLLYTSDAADE